MAAISVIQTHALLSIPALDRLRSSKCGVKGSLLSSKDCGRLLASRSLAAKGRRRTGSACRAVTHSALGVVADAELGFLGALEDLFADPQAPASSDAGSVFAEPSVPSDLPDAASPVTAIQDAIQASQEALSGTQDNTAEVFADAAADASPQAASAIESLSPATESATGTAASAADAAAETLTDAKDSVSQAVTDAVDSVSGVTAAPIDSASGALDSATNAVESVTGAVDSATGAADSASGTATSAVDSVTGAVDSAAGAADSASGAAASAVDSVVGAAAAPADSATSAADSASGAVKSAVESASGAAAAPLDSASGAATSAADSVTGTVTSAADSATGAVTEAADVATGAVKDAVNSAGTALSGTLDQSKSAVSSAQIAVQSAIKGGTDSVRNALRSLVDAYDNAVHSLQASVGAATSSLQEKASSATDGIRNPQVSLPRVELPKVTLPAEVTETIEGAVGGVRGALDSAVGSVQQAAGAALASVHDALPPEVASKLDVAGEKIVTVGAPLAGFLKQTVLQVGAAAWILLRRAEVAAGVNPDDPLLKAGVIAGVSLLVGVYYWRARYGGYSGDLSPPEALKLLSSDFNAVLVDVRPQDLREREGIPDLRRSARFKDAAVEFVKLGGQARGQLRNPDDVELQLWAAVVKGLKGVDSGTKVIVLDDNGGQSKSIARVLKKAGIDRSYRVEGGYRAWADDLRTRPDAPQTPIEIVKEEVQAFLEELKPTSLGVTAAVAGLGLAGYALYEWEHTLQILGLVAIAQGTIKKVNSYNSIEDVQADIRLLLTPFRWLAAGAIQAGKLVDSRQGGKRQLAMSPSDVEVMDTQRQISSAPQERVAQITAGDESPSEKV
eukprot:jgi/Mesen1/7750/ME000407S06948